MIEQVDASAESPAFARQHDDAYLRIVVELPHRLRDRMPQIAIEGIELVRPVEPECRYGAVTFEREVRELFCHCRLP